MDIQADIKWIRAELKSVRNPHLIEAFKQLLKYRGEEKVHGALNESLERAKADKAEGRTRSHDEVKAKYDKWPSSRGHSSVRNVRFNDRTYITD